MPWGGYLRDAAHTGLIADAELPALPGTEPEDCRQVLCYSQPGRKRLPMPGLRWAVANAATRIKILDVLACRYWEMTASAFASADNEQRFDVTGTSRGIYRSGWK